MAWGDPGEAGKAGRAKRSLGVVLAACVVPADEAESYGDFSRRRVDMAL
ncbi:hypothetical protein ACH4TE_12215 [Streptomyces sioyaensis]